MAGYKTYQPYNPNAYVRGGASPAVAKQTQAKGYQYKPPPSPYVPTWQAGLDPAIRAGMVNAGTWNGGAGAPGLPATPQPSQGPVNQNYDYGNDPILQMYNQEAAAQKTRKEAELMEQQKRILLGFGSRTLAESVLGTSSDPFLDSISDDPDKSQSALAQLGYDFRRNKLGLTEAENNNNLFYSGHHDKSQQELARDRLLLEAGLTSQTQGNLSQLQMQFQSFLDAQRMAKIGWEQDAFMRAMANAMGQGSYGQGGDSPPAAAPEFRVAQDGPAPIVNQRTMEQAADYYAQQVANKNKKPPSPKLYGSIY